MGQIHKTRKTRHWTIRVVFTSGSNHFLEDLNKNISINYNVLGVISQGKGNYYRLTFSMNGALKLYEIMYNKSPSKLFLKRKKVVFEKFIKKKVKD